LEVIKVEEGYAKQPCAVCFEELLIGGEAIMLLVVGGRIIW
jgi:hypothetical protein